LTILNVKLGFALCPQICGMRASKMRYGKRLEWWLLIGGLVTLCALCCALVLGAGAVNSISRTWEQEQLA
jgi:hypothetical protein